MYGCLRYKEVELCVTVCVHDFFSLVSGQAVVSGIPMAPKSLKARTWQGAQRFEFKGSCELKAPMEASIVVGEGSKSEETKAQTMHGNGWIRSLEGHGGKDAKFIVMYGCSYQHHTRAIGWQSLSAAFAQRRELVSPIPVGRVALN